MPCSDLEDRETAAQWNTVDVDEQREKHYTKNGRREKAWKKQVKEREGVDRESQQKRVTRACERRTKSPGRGKRAAWFGREEERSDEKKRGQREAGSVEGGGGEWNGWTGERPAASLRTTWPHRPCRHHSASPASFQRLGLAFQPANSSPTGLLPDRSPASLRSRFASSRPIVPESSNRYSFSQPEQIHSLISCSSAAARYPRHATQRAARSACQLHGSLLSWTFVQTVVFETRWFDRVCEEDSELLFHGTLLGVRDSWYWRGRFAFMVGLWWKQMEGFRGKVVQVMGMHVPDSTMKHLHCVQESQQFYYRVI